MAGAAAAGGGRGWGGDEDKEDEEGEEDEEEGEEERDDEEEETPPPCRFCARGDAHRALSRWSGSSGWHWRTEAEGTATATGGKGGVLAAQPEDTTRQRRCLSRAAGGYHKAKAVS